MVVQSVPHMPQFVVLEEVSTQPALGPQSVRVESVQEQEPLLQTAPVPQA